MSQMPEIRKNLNRLHCRRVVKHHTQTRFFQSHAPWALSTLCAALLLSGCGGGGSSSDPVTDPVVAPSTTASISGTVPGTLIEAFCANGAYYKVSSTNNGTAQHPFTLALPSNLDCRLVMTTNETDLNNRVITPIRFNQNSSASGLINLQGALALGYVPLEMNRNNITDTNSDGVTDVPLKVDINSTLAVVRQVSYDPLDSDDDDIPNVYEDDDDDSRFNREDDDDDGNDVKDDDDEDDHDHDDDGIDDDYDHDQQTTPVATPLTPVQNYTVTNGRLLVSQCAQCHGTNGRSVTGWDSITDEGQDLADEMLDDAAIMTAQAHGYTSTEIAAMSAWLIAQPSSSATSDDDGDDNDDDHDD